jgi:serine/threonine protein kinase
MCGTPSYLAPEVVKQENNEGYDNVVDSWSVGVIVFSMYVPCAPVNSVLNTGKSGSQIPVHSLTTIPNEIFVFGLQNAASIGVFSSVWIAAI